MITTLTLLVAYSIVGVLGKVAYYDVVKEKRLTYCK